MVRRQSLPGWSQRQAARSAPMGKAPCSEPSFPRDGFSDPRKPRLESGHSRHPPSRKRCEDTTPSRHHCPRNALHWTMATLFHRLGDIHPEQWERLSMEMDGLALTKARTTRYTPYHFTSSATHCRRTRRTLPPCRPPFSYEGAQPVSVPSASGTGEPFHSGEKND